MVVDHHTDDDVDAFIKSKEMNIRVSYLSSLKDITGLLKRGIRGGNDAGDPSLSSTGDASLPTPGVPTAASAMDVDVESKKRVRFDDDDGYGGEADVLWLPDSDDENLLDDKKKQ